MEKTFNLQSGKKVIQDNFVLHTADFGFTAGLRKNWKSEFDGYTSFRFRNEFIDNYLDVMNSGVVETLSFDYDEDNLIELNLSRIKSLSSLRRIYFDLNKRISVFLENSEYQALSQLVEISLKGNHSPENFAIGQIANQLGLFEISFEIFKIIHKDISNLKTLRLIGSEKKWNGHELNYLKNLKRIHLDSGLIGSLDFISVLQEIQILIVTGCKNLKDISSLSNLRHLRHLVILDCPNIKNWSVLNEISLLKSLRVKKSIDFPVLDNLPNLCYFSIDDPKKGEVETWVKNQADINLGGIVNADLNSLIKSGVVT